MTIIVTQTIYSMFKTASLRRFWTQSKSSQVPVDIIFREIFRELVKLQADKSNLPDVVIEGTLTLTPQDSLLL
jgi:hypothetical protein